MRYGALALLTIACTATIAESDDDVVAAAFVKAAHYVYYKDFIHDPVADAFTSPELQALGAHRSALASLVNDAFDTPAPNPGVGAALMAAHFKLEAALPSLRIALFEPGRTYGWEGHYESDEERYYADGQYVYHSAYVSAIETITGKPLGEAIQLSEKEARTLCYHVKIPRHESHHWGIWLARKFELDCDD